ncbi:MAG TPA: hypothetical protein VM452_18215, partial [Caulifigura sp.]|nr:hypothetical protein [Caulifigura sp.]
MTKPAPENTTDRPRSRRWPWLAAGVLALAIGVGWQVARSRQRQAAWVDGVVATGAVIETPQPADVDLGDVIGTLVYGKTTIVWINHESQLREILALEGAPPRGTHFNVISQVSQELLAEFRRRFRPRPVAYNPELDRLLQLE